MRLPHVSEFRTACRARVLVIVPAVLFFLCPQSLSPAADLPAKLQSHPIFLPPSVRSHLDQLVKDRSPQWLAFRNRLNEGLELVVEGGYQASQLHSLSNYALGYQILKNSHPDTAQRYADKAIAILKSGLHDFQKGGWATRQFLARGDGRTRSFPLPHKHIIARSVKAYRAPVTVKSITHGKSDGQEEVAWYARFLKVSNTADGPADYQEGSDWRHNPDLFRGMIDWSPPGAEPAPGSKYFVTLTSAIESTLAKFQFTGGSVLLDRAPAVNEAIFV